MKTLHIGILGSGNLATHLAEGLFSAGYSIHFISSRNKRKGRLLAEKVGSVHTAVIPESTGVSALLFICISDDAIPEMLDKYRSTGYTLIHCSGSIALPESKTYSAGTGVFYPVQSFSPGIQINWLDIPVCVEASDRKILAQLEGIASSLSKKVIVMSSQNRLIVHLAAVFANNFSNAQYAIAEDILSAHKLPFDIIRPLIQMTAYKVQEASPSQVQTGPAKRNDLRTINKHLALLKEEPGRRKVYRTMTDFIRMEEETKTKKKGRK